MKAFKPLIFFTTMILLTGLACNAILGGGDSQPQDQQSIDSQAPGDDQNSVPSAGQYFSEEFDRDPAWHYFLTSGNPNAVTVNFTNGRMNFDLEDVEINAVYLYEDEIYDNVRVDLRAENRGRNNNRVGLICRASDQGWYQFSTEGGGLWYLYGVEIRENKYYFKRINNGGALSLKQGKETNEYGMICDGPYLTLIINGETVVKIEDTKFDFQEGTVGFSIASLNVTPIILEVDWFKAGSPQ